MEKMRRKALSFFSEIEGALHSKSALLRALASVYLFDFLDRLRLNCFPQNWFELLKSEVSRFYELSDFITTCYDIPHEYETDRQLRKGFTSLEKKTGKVYFELWEKFSKEEYFLQATNLMKLRLERNMIDISSFRSALDAGCGGGRYSIALRKIGIGKVTAVDVSLDSIRFAKEMSTYPKDEIRFLLGSVLDLPFEENSFDFVFSNGVLHHTPQGQSLILQPLQFPVKCFPWHRGNPPYVLN